MKIAVRHNLQVYDPAETSLRAEDAYVLPVREAQAVMGETVAAYLERVEWHFDLPTICRVNGHFYGRAEWDGLSLAVNDNVEFVSRPLGGGSGGSTIKTIASVVALVALTAVAGPAGAAAATAVGATAGTFAATAIASVISAAIVGAGAMAISYFLKPKSGGKTNATDALYSFGFQGNQARPMQPIPVLHGRLRFSPDYAAPTYSEFVGDGMIDYALYGITCGRWLPEQVLIGDTPIWNRTTGYVPEFPGIEIQFCEPGEEVTLYPVNVVTAEELAGAELTTTYTPGYIVNAAGTEATKLLLDFVWPGGAYHTDSKSKLIRADTHILARARTVGPNGAPTGDWIELWSKIYSNSKNSQIRVTEAIDVPAGRWQVAVRRVNEPTASDNGTDAVTWSALRAHIKGPQSFPRVSVMAVKGVASKQLSGVSGGQLRVIGTRILPVWRNGEFVEEPTRSIAWAALDWWRNPYYGAGLSLADVDFPAFVQYDALWQTLGHTFDRRTTEVQNLDDVLETTLKVGRAFPAPVGDKLTITREEPRGLPRMLFTENDIVRDSLEIEYTLSDQAWADGIVGEYVDQETWRLAEVSSAPDGVVLLNPARVQLEGVVDRKQATGMVRFMAAESQYRRITVSWIARMEGRLLKRGSLVKLSASEPETWGQSCEIVAADPDGMRIQLDPMPVWETGSSHYVEIRGKDGRPWGPARVTRGATDAFAVLNATDAANLATKHNATALQALLRASEEEPAWVAFSPGQPRPIAVLITEGDPDQDGEHIHLKGVLDAPEVYDTTEEGVPPLLQIPDLFSNALPVIVGLVGSISQRQLALILTAGWQGAKNAVTYIADVSYDGGVQWVRAYEGDRTAFEAVVGASASMKVRVKGITPAGLQGAWFITDVTAPDLIVSNGKAGLIAIDYVDLTGSAKAKLDHILEVEAYAQAVAVESKADYTAALARAEEVRAYAQGVSAQAQANFQAAIGRAEEVQDYAEGVAVTAGDALGKAIQSLRNDEANQAAIVQEATARLTADEATTRVVEGAIARIGASEAAIVSERETRATADSATATRIDGLSAIVGQNSASIVNEASARAEGDRVQAERTSALIVKTDADRAYFLAEQRARIDSDEASATSLTALGVQVGNDRAYFLAEQTARINQDGVFASDLTAVRTRLGTNEAAILSEANARSGADSAQATRIDGLTATVGQNTAGLVEERQARADGDGAVTRYVQSLEATVGGNYGALLSEIQTRADADSAMSSRIDSFSAQVGDSGAAIVEERRVRAEADSANASRSANIESYVFGVNTPGGLPQTRASVLSEAQTRADADSAAATRIDGLSARVGGNEASIIEERQVRADADSANTRYIQSIETTVGSNYNLLLTEQTTRATQDQAITGYVSYVESVVGSNYSQLVDERNTRANADSALSQRIESTLATVANNYTLLTDETTARVNADNALAQRITDVQARTDAGTATGRFSLVAQSGPAGVSARIQALVAVQAGGQTRGAGFYVEAMDDGTSRFVVDASAFYITANGQSMPTFSFDGYTLTIPSLRVTQQAILPNSASDKRIAGNDNMNFDPAPFADGWREIPGTAIDFNVDSETWGLTWTATTALTVTATGTNATYKSVSLETAVAINGNIYNNYTTNSVAIGAGGGVANGPTPKSSGGIGTTGMEIFGPGQQRISLYYRFKGDAGCTGRINYAVLKTLIQKR